MPHINLIYGFIPDEYFAEAAEKIANKLDNFEPFEITFSRFNTFEHRKSCTAWLQPDPDRENVLQDLQASLESIFPQCNEQSSKSAAGFTPHLTVGQFKKAADAKENLPQWHPVSFKVESIYLISRRGEDPFEVRYRIDFGKKNPICLENNRLSDLVDSLEPPLNNEQKQHRETITEIVRQACQELLGDRTSLNVIGSSRMGTDSKNSDLDLLCTVPLEIYSETFLEDLDRNLKGLSERSRIIKQARVPLLQMNIEGLSLDLLLAKSPNGILPASTDIELDSTSWQAVIVYWEAETIINTVSKSGNLELFRLLARSIRAWAKLRHIHGKGWGFLSSYSWTFLAANICAANASKNLKIEELLVNFFEMLAGYDWSKPIALSTAGKEYKIRTPTDWLPIISSIPPVQNTARNITRSTAKFLLQEFDRAAKISREILDNKGDWSELFSEAYLLSQSKLFLVLKATNKGSLEKCNGWLKGNILGLIIDLEKQFKLEVRPWNGVVTKDNSSFVILGLQVEDERDIFAIEAVTEQFLAEFNGVVWDCFVCERFEIAEFNLL